MRGASKARDVAARGLGVEDPVACGTPQQTLGSPDGSRGGFGIARFDGLVRIAYRTAEPAPLVTVPSTALDRLPRSLYCRLVVRHDGLPGGGRIAPPTGVSTALQTVPWVADTPVEPVGSLGGGVIRGAGQLAAWIPVCLVLTGVARGGELGDVPVSVTQAAAVLDVLSPDAAAALDAVPQDAAAAAAEVPASIEASVPPAAPSGLAPASAGPARTVRAHGRGPIERAWHTPSATLEDRVWRTRRAALERGVWNLDAAAWALIGGSGDPLERTEAAVRLAPDLPAARMAWARARWLHGGSPLAALRTAMGALAAFGRHPEGALWLGGSLLALLAMGLFYGGLLAIGIASLLALPHAAHDLGDLAGRRMPQFARAALLASLVLVPLAFGEGFLGLGVALVAVGVAYGTRRQRVALAIASAGVVLGAFPVAEAAGRALEAFPNDPVARAALATSRGIALPEDVARLEAAPGDPLAREALARLARRDGSMGSADAAYQALLEVRSEDPVVLSNAGNVRLHLGHMEAALELYRRALEIEESAVVLYNVSQAYGRAFRIDDLTQALELAQGVGGELIADLTRLQGTQPEGFVVDLPMANAGLWDRVLERADGRRWAADLRAAVAPGRLGTSLAAAVTCFAVALLGGSLAALRLRASRWCARCGRRVCPRCHPEATGGELCRACNQLYYHPEQTDRYLRMARIEALRERARRLDKLAWAVSVVLPGIAGVLAQRPLLSVLGAFWFVVAVTALLVGDLGAPDPLVAGAAGPFAFLCVGALAALGYALAVGLALASRRKL